MTTSHIYFSYDGEWLTNEGETKWHEGPRHRMGLTFIDFPDYSLDSLTKRIESQLGLELSKKELKFSFVPTNTNFSSSPMYVTDDNSLKAYVTLFVDPATRPCLCIEEYEKEVDIESVFPSNSPLPCEDLYFRNISFMSSENLPFPSDRNVVRRLTYVAQEKSSSPPLRQPSHSPNDTFRNERSPSPPLRTTSNPSDSLPKKDTIFSFPDESTLAIHQEFESQKKVMKYLKNIALSNNFEFRVVKVNSGVYSIKCKGENCGWNVLARRIPRTARFSIRRHEVKHTCDISKRTNHHPQASYDVVADLITEHYGNTVSIPVPKEIIKMVKDKKGTDISYSKARRGRDHAVKERLGDPVQCFRLLPAYLYMVEEKNPGIKIHVLCYNSYNTLEHLYMNGKPYLLNGTPYLLNETPYLVT